MKLSIRSGLVLEFRVQGPGYWERSGIFTIEMQHRPAPSTECPASLELDFFDARYIRDALTKMLHDAACPTCGAKGAPK